MDARAAAVFLDLPFDGDVVGGGGEIGEPVDVDGVSDRGGVVGLEVEVKPVGAGSERVEDGERVVGGPGDTAFLKRDDRVGEAVLRLDVVVGEPDGVAARRDQTQDAQLGVDAGVEEVDARIGAGV